MDFRELNQYVDTFTADADVCASKPREWRQHGSNVSLLDLRKAYLQVLVGESLWPFQMGMFAGRRYWLTRLGFGLNVVPQGNYQCRVVSRRDSKWRDVSVHKWHLCRRKHCVITAAVPDILTRRTVFSLCGRLVGHLHLSSGLLCMLQWVLLC